VGALPQSTLYARAPDV